MSFVEQGEVYRITEDLGVTMEDTLEVGRKVIVSHIWNSDNGQLIFLLDECGVEWHFPLRPRNMYMAVGDCLNICRDGDVIQVYERIGTCSPSGEWYMACDNGRVYWPADDNNLDVRHKLGPV